MNNEQEARNDAKLLGLGFLVDGKRVEPNRVVIFRDGASNTLAELEDLINDAIADSLDMDWTPKQGAKGVIAVLQREGYVVVQRGEDSEVAIAIGEHAFNAGFKAAALFAEPGNAKQKLSALAEAARVKAWSDYTPPEDLCGRALS